MATILIVDDNRLNRDMLTRRLKREGYTTVVAVDGLQAVELAASARPDVILMDMNLPKIDGWETTKRIKSNELTANIPIIGLSAHAMSFHRDKALEAGCIDYDSKPVDFQRLLDKLTPLLADSKTVAQ